MKLGEIRGLTMLRNRFLDIPEQFNVKVAAHPIHARTQARTHPQSHARIANRHVQMLRHPPDMAESSPHGAERDQRKKRKTDASKMDAKHARLLDDESGVAPALRSDDDKRGISSVRHTAAKRGERWRYGLLGLSPSRPSPLCLKTLCQDCRITRHTYPSLAL